MDGFFANIELWLGELGVWAYVVAPAVMAAVSVLPIPAEAPAMANGMLFGAVGGSVVTWVGAMAGAWMSYELARIWGRPLATRMIGAETVAKVDITADKAGWWGLLVLRFIPVIAFTALNWGAGLCAVPRGRFLWTTALGIVPGVVLFTTSGVGISALWRRSPPLAGGVVMALVIVMLVWSVRRGESRAVG